MDFRGPKKNRRMSIELNVTSFVDIIFNLLVFFILSTSFATGATSAGLVVQLPNATNADTKIGDRDLVIALTKEGQVVVHNRSVEVDEIAGLIDEWRRQTGGDGFVIVQADSEVTHGRVVEVMDKVKSKGISRIVIAAQGR